jgi:hypothetical protein
MSVVVVIVIVDLILKNWDLRTAAAADEVIDDDGDNDNKPSYTYANVVMTIVVVFVVVIGHRSSSVVVIGRRIDINIKKLRLRERSTIYYTTIHRCMLEERSYKTEGTKTQQSTNRVSSLAGSRTAWEYVMRRADEYGRFVFGAMWLGTLWAKWLKFDLETMNNNQYINTHHDHGRNRMWLILSETSLFRGCMMHRSSMQKLHCEHIIIIIIITSYPHHRLHITDGSGRGHHGFEGWWWWMVVCKRYTLEEAGVRGQGCTDGVVISRIRCTSSVTADATCRLKST